MAVTPATLPVLKSLEDFLGGSYDYIIVGGGTAGLTLAGRLSEDPSISVGVIEAGGAKIDDPSVMTPAAFPTLFGKDGYDWKFMTVPQAGTNGTVHAWTRGKLLGGSSAINYMMFAKGQKEEFDDWNEIAGVKGWGWDEIRPYFTKCENFLDAVDPSETRPGDFAFEKEHHGHGGPIQVSYPNYRSTSELAYHAAAVKYGLDIPKDAWSGENHGVFASLSTIDRSGVGTRSYSVTGYLIPNGQRPNLAVLTDALVEKVAFGKDKDAPVVEGVTFSHGDKSYTVSAKAVVLSAGTVQTPQLLELSGIGSKSVLDNAGVECILDNERVGDVEDHVMTGIAYDLVDGEFSLDHLNKPENAMEALKTYAAGKGGPMANGISNNAYLSLFDVADELERERAYALVETQRSKLTNDFDRKRSDKLLTRLKDPKAGIYQLISPVLNIDFAARHDMQAFLAPSPDTTRFSTCVCLHHAFSRGSIHITSSDPKVYPAIDPAMLQHPVDELLLAYALRGTDRILRTSPMKEKTAGRVQPAQTVNLEDIEAAVKYVKAHTGTEYHPVASASLGLVVDENLNVKGVKGLKVCDASVIPLHISGNTQATCYAIGERLADMIKEEHKGLKDL